MKLELPSVCFAKWDDLESRSYNCTLVNLLLVPSSLHLISLSAKFLLFERTFLFEVLKKFWGGYHSRCFCRYILSFTLQAQSKSDCKWNQVWGSLVSWATDKRVCRVHDKHNSRHRMQSAKLSLFSNVFFKLFFIFVVVSVVLFSWVLSWLSLCIKSRDLPSKVTHDLQEATYKKLLFVDKLFEFFFWNFVWSDNSIINNLKSQMQSQRDMTRWVNLRRWVQQQACEVSRFGQSYLEREA